MRACCRSGDTDTRVIVTKPMPGSCTSRASSCAISLRIWSPTRAVLEPCAIRYRDHENTMARRSTKNPLYKPCFARASWCRVFVVTLCEEFDVRSCDEAGLDA